MLLLLFTSGYVFLLLLEVKHAIFRHSIMLTQDFVEARERVCLATGDWEVKSWCLSCVFFLCVFFHPQAQFEGGPRLCVPFVSLSRLLTCISFHKMKVLHKLCTGFRTLITEKSTPSQDVRLMLRCCELLFHSAVYATLSVHSHVNYTGVCFPI